MEAINHVIPKDSRAIKKSRGAVSVREKGQEVSKDEKNTSRTSDILKTLRQRFPGAKIDIGDLVDNGDIRDYAMNHYGSFQIVISSEALRKMAESPEFLKRCMDSIEEARREQRYKIRGLSGQNKTLLGCGIVLDEEGNTAQWTATVKNAAPSWGMDTASKGSYNSISRYHVKDSIITVKKKLSYAPSRDLLKIANSRNQQAVKKTISGIYAQIYRLKISGGDKKVVAQLVGQAEKVLLKAKLKDKLLKKEELLEYRQKLQKARAQFKKAAQTRRMLRDKRVARRSREYGQVRDYYPTPAEREEEKRLERQEKAYEQYIENSAAPDMSAAASAEAALTQSAGAVNGVVIDVTV